MNSSFNLTKNELKRQRDLLQRYTRYLPTLQLKKRQLLWELHRTQQLLDELEAAQAQTEREVEPWAGVFAEGIDITQLLSLSQVLTDIESISGVDVPVFREALFLAHPFDDLSLPLWVDSALEVYQLQLSRAAQQKVARTRHEQLSTELRIVVQRISLFEKVKIPQTLENIRRIQIHLGDQQTAEVVRRKIAKKQRRAHAQRSH